jgi:hypothetical protein
VRYVVVGGVAVTLQEHIRATVDLDLAPENVRAAVEVLTGLGLVPRLPVRPEDFADPAVRQAWVEQRNLTAFSLHDPTAPRREVDLLAAPEVPVEELLDGAEPKVLGGVAVPVASRAHLIAMKRAAGRPQDLADVAALEALEAGGA